MIPFAAQHVGSELAEIVVEAYHRLARKGAVIDYAFHMIVADPTEETVKEHIPAMVREGHGFDQALHDLRSTEGGRRAASRCAVRGARSAGHGLRARREPWNDCLDG